MATETKIQELVHRLEEGGWAKWIRLAIVIALVAVVTVLWFVGGFFGNAGFKGLSHPRAMEQAEIARNLADKHGFSTKVARPAELWIYKQNKGSFPAERVPDTYHAPLWPTVLAPFVLMVKGSWNMTEHDIIYPADRMVAAVALAFFLASVVVQYFVALRLFDQRMAMFGVALMLICDEFWRFSMSGLPQMLMLFLFSCATYALVRLVEEQEEALAPADLELAEEGSAPNALAAAGAETRGESRAAAGFDEPPPQFGFPWWALVAGLCFGLLALTHSLTIWIALGAMLFSAIYFRGRRLLVTGILGGMLVLCYAPWLYRNYVVCGDPLGVSWYTIFYQVRGTESAIMRSKEAVWTGVSPSFFVHKIQDQILWQIGNLPLQHGYSVMAPVFLLALLHRFKRPQTGNFRWCVLLMYLFALAGMIVTGLDDQPVKANDLHVLFIPALAFYGMAFLLVLWSRLEINVNVLRYAFIGLLFLLSGIPFLYSFFNMLFGQPTVRVAWPPYMPPYIAIFRSWTTEKEIIMTDMPWAVAWYADRRALWLPAQMEDYIEINDYDLLHGRVVGLYLTPVSRNRNYLYDVYKGEYKPWWRLITLTADLRNFPLRAYTPMPYDGDCIFYADRDRWTKRED
jgi:hypothetical protein